MKKKGVILFILIVLSVLFVYYLITTKPVLLSPAEFVLNNQVTFDEGVYSNTLYNTNKNAVELVGGEISGSYTSKIFDSSNAATTWNTLTLSESIPYGEPFNSSLDDILLVHFDQASGSSIEESSGYNVPGTIFGTVEFSQEGKFNNSFGFSKTSEGYVKFLNESFSPTQITDQLSVEFWFKRKNTGNFASEIFVRKGSESSISTLEWDITGLTIGSILRLRVRNATTTKSLNTITTFDNTNWHHLVAVYNGSMMSLYVDGKFDSSIAHFGNISSDGYNLTISSKTIGTFGAPNAFIDELVMYNRPLEQAEIKEHYKRGILELATKVRSCDDINCDNEPWSDSYTSPQINLSSILENRYFQFESLFSTEDSAYTPEMNSVVISYSTPEIPIFPNLTAEDLLGRPTGSSILVNLVNGPDNIDIYVEYGETSSQPGSYSYLTEPQLNVAPDSIIEIPITNLNADTKYYYRVRAKKSTDGAYASSEEKSFRTKRSSAPFTFTLFSDAHIAPSQQQSSDTFTTLLENAAQNDNADFAFHLGDNIMVPEQHDGFNSSETAKTYYKTLRKNLNNNSIPSFFVIGNWEGENGWTPEPNIGWARDARKTYIPNPEQNTYAQGGNQDGHEDYYAFTWGNSLFITLNTMSYTTSRPTTGEDWTLGQAQLDWLNATLRNSQEPWKFILIHHPVGGNCTNCAGPGASYGRGGGLAAHVGEQEIIHQLMKENNVQAFFYGHDHLFIDIVVDNIHYTDAGRIGSPPSFVDAYQGYSYWMDYGRTKVEVLSDELTKVYYASLSEETVAEYTIDRLAPRVVLNTLDEAEFESGGTVELFYEVNDSSPIENCSLILNENLTLTQTEITIGGTENFNLVDLGDGDYSWQVECTESIYANASNYISFAPNKGLSEEETFSVGTVSGNAENIGGGGGGHRRQVPSFQNNIYPITQEEFESGVSKQLRENDAVQIKIENKLHNIKLLDAKTNMITIEVSSQPQRKDILLGQEAKFDLTEDGVYDVSVKFESIEGNNVVLSIKKIAQEENNQQNIQKKKNVPIKENKPAQDSNETGTKDISKIIILLFLIGILIVLILLKLFHKKRKKKIRR